MNRVVYDSVDEAPKKIFGDDNEETKTSDVEDKANIATGAGIGENSQANQSECDNDSILTPYYIPNFKNDHTLVFESRFETGNLRRAI